MRILVWIMLVLGLSAPVFAEQGNLIKEAQLRQVVQDYLLKKTEGINAEVTVKRISLSGDVKLPPGAVSFEVIAPERWAGWGTGSLALVVRVDDQVKRNITVQVEVEALTEMVVASRTLERGEVLQASDLSLAKRDLAKVSGRFCRDLSEVLGLRLKTAVHANAPVRSDNLERVPLIKSGQLITIVAENDAVRITASGKAKGAGAAGDLIAVLNLTSQKEIAARVVDASTVRVDF